MNKSESKKRAKILLIDDDIDIIEATTTVLESKDYQVISASEGEEGLRRARQENPDLIILDVIMPVKDGFTVAEQLKKDPALAGIPVVMLTGYSSKGGESSIPRSRGYTLEAEDYLEKPVTPQDLLAAVEKALKRAGS